MIEIFVILFLLMCVFVVAPKEKRCKITIRRIEDFDDEPTFNVIVNDEEGYGGTRWFFPKWFEIGDEKVIHVYESDLK